jgi:uracil-DNA glycosylase
MPAPRRALSNCRKRRLTEEECAPIIEALGAIKKKKAEIVLALTQTALDALLKLEAIEEEIDAEARKVHEDYVNSIEDYKVTFQPFYQEQAEELDEPPPTLEDARFLVQKMNQDASNTLTGEATVVVGDDE